MRTSKAFLSCTTVAAAVMLLAATSARASDSGGSVPTAAPPPPPTSCSTGLFSVSVSRGPSFVSCTPTSTNPSGQCTEIEYTVTGGGTPDHVAAVEGIGIQYVTGPGNQFYAPCKGDPVTDVGENSCHEQAAKFNPSSSVKTFTIGLAGQRKSSATTIATKKGSNIGKCRIEGVGLEGLTNPFQLVSTTECNNFKGCVLCIQKDPQTGDPLNAFLDTEQSTKPLCSASGADPHNCCSDPVISTIDQLSLSIEGIGDLGPPQIGDGFVSSGTNSCTTRVIGGRLYTWGTPCP
jgi:hypothetical protein